jgi:hypothetical protein
MLVLFLGKDRFWYHLITVYDPVDLIKALSFTRLSSCRAVLVVCLEQCRAMFPSVASARELRG